MKLSFVNPHDGKKVAKLQVEELEKMTAVWKSAIVLYVVGFSPTIIAANWNSVAKPKVFLHDDGYFVIQFQSVASRDAILCNGPYHFLGKPIIMNLWSENFHFHDEILNVARVQQKFGHLWQWSFNYCSSSKGRIRVGWKPVDIDLQVLVTHEQYIHVSVACFFTFVYGLHTITDRLPLWHALQGLACS